MPIKNVGKKIVQPYCIKIRLCKFGFQYNNESFKMNKFLLALCVIFIVVLYSFNSGESEWRKVSNSDAENVTLENVRLALGAEKSSFYMESFDPEKAKIGLELILKGKTKRGLFKSKAISSYFVCTDCHNIGREFKNSSDQNPSRRLDFAEENNLPFLPASTFWGIYNRTSFYNDDYIKKYGDIIKDAKQSLSGSIQVCAKYCSSGRYLKSWELEAIMHYFKANELKSKDLSLTNNQKDAISRIQLLDENEKADLLASINSAFTHGYSAHFGETMPRDDRKYGVGGDVVTGKFIYDKACLHCHLDGRVTFLKLDSDKLSAQMFLKYKSTYDDLSVYQIIRQGTYAMPGRNQYMPRFTKDKMSDQQIEDLMAYLTQLAEK